MNKARRIAIGGWFSKALSIMTRGWFGGVTPEPEPLVICDFTLPVGSPLTYQLQADNAPAFSLQAADVLAYSLPTGMVDLSLPTGAPVEFVFMVGQPVEKSLQVEDVAAFALQVADQLAFVLPAINLIAETLTVDSPLAYSLPVSNILDFTLVSDCCQ